MLRMLAATPKLPFCWSTSTRTTEAWQQTHCFSLLVISGGSINTISSWLPSLICESVYKKTPPSLRSRVTPLVSIDPPEIFTETGTRTGVRCPERRSCFSSAMEVGSVSQPLDLNKEKRLLTNTRGKPQVLTQAITQPNFSPQAIFV
jgi:hypothetical protein